MILLCFFSMKSELKFMKHSKVNIIMLFFVKSTDIPSFQVIDIWGEGGAKAWERQGWCGRGLRATDPRAPRPIYLDVPCVRNYVIWKLLFDFCWQVMWKMWTLVRQGLIITTCSPEHHKVVLSLKKISGITDLP